MVETTDEYELGGKVIDLGKVRRSKTVEPKTAKVDFRLSVRTQILYLDENVALIKITSWIEGTDKKFYEEHLTIDVKQLF